MMEKLGVEKEQLLQELQSDFSRKKLEEHQLHKTAAPASQRAQAANEIEQIKNRIDELQRKS